MNSVQLKMFNNDIYKFVNPTFIISDVLIAVTSTGYSSVELIFFVNVR